MSPSLRLAIALVTGWTRLYTWRMPDVPRDRRRAEIESDLWEFHEDARGRRHSPPGIAVHMVLRLAAGLPHDLLWRLENIDEASRARGRAVWLTANAAGVSACVAAVWISFLITYFVSLTPLPDSTRVERTFIRTARSLPPPPPPPPLPPIGAVSRSWLRMPPPPPPPQ